jgi:hypothetical protein
VEVDVRRVLPETITDTGRAKHTGSRD